MKKIILLYFVPIAILFFCVCFSHGIPQRIIGAIFIASWFWALVGFIKLTKTITP